VLLYIFSALILFPRHPLFPYVFSLEIVINPSLKNPKSNTLKRGFKEEETEEKPNKYRDNKFKNGTKY